MLVYSRPKGTYNGAAAERILLDFYLLGATLGENRFSVRATIKPPTGEPNTLRVTNWAPLMIVNLPNGDTSVALDLLDREGKALEGTWAHVERVITVNRNAP